LPTIIIAVVLVLIGIYLSRLLKKVSIKAMKAKDVDPTVYQFIARVISAFVKLIFFLSALSMFIKITSLLAAFSAVGVAIGLGLQDSVAQIASGVQILLTRPFKDGDFVEVGGLSGSIVEIRFMNTILMTPDNKRIVIPNSDMTKNRIVNYSAEENRRVDLTFSIGYSDDISKAKAVILETALANSAVLQDPAPSVVVMNHGASAIELSARLWCKSSDYWDVYFAMEEGVKIAFDKNKINIPFDQLDVHIVEK
ncbi:MAG: mechanosensitive ion channel, partial [Clostridia bacterium]|nr:mechanosensitive ion channel [Clostridia bacterium]